MKKNLLMKMNGKIYLMKRIYEVGDQGFAEIHDNGDIEVFAVPTLASGDGQWLPMFSMDVDGNPIPLMDKEDIRIKLSANAAPEEEEVENGGWSIL